MLSMKQLQLDEVRDIYYKYLVNDFPIEEIKAIELVEHLVKIDAYICYGLYEEANLVAYAFFCKDCEGKIVLLDYIAVLKDYRSYGYGSKFLNEMRKELKDYQGIIFEVESGKSALDKDALKICERRIAFYLRNGVRDTIVSCFYFGIDMKVMFMPLITDLEDKKIKEVLSRIYQIMYTKDENEKKLKFYMSEVI